MPDQQFRITMLGPQGAGKGTQAERLAATLGVPTVSTGALYREEIAKGTPLGVEAKTYMDAGKLVPDSLTNRLMEETAKRADMQNGWIIDGYPRNMIQFDALMTFGQPTHAILVDLSDEEALKRLEGRRSCLVCKKGYHTMFVPPKVTDVCDACGGTLVQRDDDKPDAIKKRLEIYHAETEPIIQKFEELGILHRVDGSKTIDEVEVEIGAVLSR
jgi:adenylate kinase